MTDKILELKKELDKERIYYIAMHHYQDIINDNDFSAELSEKIIIKDIKIQEAEFSLVLDHFLFSTPHVKMVLNLTAGNSHQQIGKFTYLEDIEGNFREEFFEIY